MFNYTHIEFLDKNSSDRWLDVLDAAAWFAEAATVNQTVWQDSFNMETHDFNLFNTRYQDISRLAMKSEPPRQFWVEHISIYETFLRKKRHLSNDEVDRIMQEKAKKQIASRCASALLERNAPEDQEISSKKRYLWNSDTIIGLIPYYGGAILRTSKGNAHSNISRHSKFQQLHGTVCSVVAALPTAKIVIGVCNEQDLNDVKRGLGGSKENSSQILSVWEVIKFDCKQGVFLAPNLLRYFQERHRAGDWRARFVYFTEQDQILRLAPSLGTIGLMSAVGLNTYVIPNRFEVQRLKNNCGNGERFVTSVKGYQALNELPDASNCSARTTSRLARQKLLSLSFRRCRDSDDDNIKAYLVDTQSFSTFNFNRMRRDAPSQFGEEAAIDFASSLHAVDASRLLLKTASAHNFYVDNTSPPYQITPTCSILSRGKGIQKQREENLGDKYSLRGNSSAFALSHEVGKQRRRHDVLVLMAIQESQKNNEQKHLWGLCNALHLFKHVAVAYCNGDVNNKGFENAQQRSAPRWLEESGMRDRLWEVAPVECSLGPLSLGRSMLLHYQQNFLTFSPKYEKYSSFRYVLYATSATLALRVPMRRFSVLTSSLSRRTILAAHTYIPENTVKLKEIDLPGKRRFSKKRHNFTGQLWAGSCSGSSRDWLLPANVAFSDVSASHFVSPSDANTNVEEDAMLIIPEISRESFSAAWSNSLSHSSGIGCSHRHLQHNNSRIPPS